MGQKINYFVILIYLKLAYELWFKQILYEVDSVREIFLGVEKLHSIQEEGLSDKSKDVFPSSQKLRPDVVIGPKYADVDENRMLEIMNRMNRVAMILKVS